MSKMQKIAVVFLVIAAASGILHKTGVSYVPGLTALTLCVATVSYTHLDVYKRQMLGPSGVSIGHRRP